MLLYNVACTYAQLGMGEESLSALERSVEKGWGDRNWIEHDSDLNSIRDTARYKAIVQAM
jgi:adenylate cyclase